MVTTYCQDDFRRMSDDSILTLEEHMINQSVDGQHNSTLDASVVKYLFQTLLYLRLYN